MTPKDAVKLINQFRGKISGMLFQAVVSASNSVRSDVQQISQGYKFTGRHSSSWSLDGISRGVELRNEQPHAIVLETGRRAGAKRPPIKALMPWVAAKLGARTRKAQLAAAKALANKIQRRGSPAKGTIFGNYSRWERQAQNVFATELETRVKSELP